jgi:inorganic pyrophosphatase
VLRSYALCLLAIAVLFRVPHRAIVGGAPVSPAALAIDGDTLIGSRHFVRGYPATNADGSVNAVIEIPAGTTAKFEVNDDGMMRWARAREDGKRREIDYLPFVVNYGMVPQTLSPDGDPIDIVVLGRGIERARIARTRVIGVLEMRDAPDIRDDKLIAVPLDDDLRNGFSRLHELDELDAQYVAIRPILWMWFSSYWGQGGTNVVGWGDSGEAAKLLDEAKRAFSERASQRASRAPAAPRPRGRLPFAARAR